VQRTGLVTGFRVLPKVVRKEGESLFDYALGLWSGNECPGVTGKEASEKFFLSRNVGNWFVVFSAGKERFISGGFLGA
jgi:hypothetical protein